ncbi:AmpG family muropeptide MFS transporter [Kiloniella sp.]|uniref:AmpG family muropeptide MFS transporter n=1 Tax=Kiloniella sp. TaxID=1938587 RepID=UPI003B0225F4
MTEQVVKRKHSWRESVEVYLKPRVIGMLFLGFSAGLPFLLVFSTLSGWLRDVGVERTEIGFFAWISITYSIKVLWAPIVDHIQLPLLNKLGKRRSWMLLAQVGVICGLVGMSSTSPAESLFLLSVFTFMVAFFSATQDISLDAYRIEAMDREYQGAMAATYQLGYRLAVIVAGAGAFHIAENFTWSLTYQVMAACMSVGIITVFIIREPKRVNDPQAESNKFEWEKEVSERFSHLDGKSRQVSEWFFKAVIRPFSEFSGRLGWIAIVILVLIGLYRISDIVMGVMAIPLYIDLGFSLGDIANVTKIFGAVMIVVGTVVGGTMVMRFGIMRMLLLGAILVASTNLVFAYLAISGNSMPVFVVTITLDNFTAGFAGTVLIAYLSSLTSSSFAATQYALFSSFMSLPGKILAGFSGLIVDSYGYVSFFTYSSLMGVPAILLVLFLMNYQYRQKKKSLVEAGE